MFVCVLLCIAFDVQAGLVGAPKEIPVTSEDAVRTSKLALEHINKYKQLGEPRMELIEIVKATRQVVAGSLITVTLKVTEDSVVKHCEVKIVEQLWLQSVQVIKAECDGINRLVVNSDELKPEGKLDAPTL